MAEPFHARPKKSPPYPFVLDALDGIVTRTNPMFGSLALYVREKIVLSGGTTSNTFVQADSVTGSCNQTLYSGQSAAANPNPSPGNAAWNCSDQVLLLNASEPQAVMAIQDYCPICNSQFNGTSGHIDTFNTSNQSCNPHSFSDYGNYFGIRLR